MEASDSGAFAGLSSTDSFPAPRAFESSAYSRSNRRYRAAASGSPRSGCAPSPVDRAVQSARSFARALDRGAPTRRSADGRERIFPPRAMRIVGAVAAVIVCACLLRAAGFSAEPTTGADTGGAQEAYIGAANKDHRSTPASRWQRGTIPYLYQQDAQWADIPYANGTVGTSGCGPTSLAMAYVALTGRTDKDPAFMAAFSEENGFADSGLTSWLLMSDGARMLGLASRELPADAEAVNRALLNGQPVIATVGPGDFTDEGHFLLISDVAEDGTWRVHDSNSPENSARSWDPLRVLAQCRNLWAFSRA